MRFIRDYLEGKKKLLKRTEVIHFEVPRYPKLSMANLYEMLKSSEDLDVYLPIYDKTKKSSLD